MHNFIILLNVIPSDTLSQWTKKKHNTLPELPILTCTIAPDMKSVVLFVSDLIQWHILQFRNVEQTIASAVNSQIIFNIKLISILTQYRPTWN